MKELSLPKRVVHLTCTRCGKVRYQEDLEKTCECGEATVAYLTIETGDLTFRQPFITDRRQHKPI